MKSISAPATPGLLTRARVELQTRSGLVVSSLNLPDLRCHQFVPYRPRQQTDPALPTPPYKITGISSNMITAHLDLSLLCSSEKIEKEKNIKIKYVRL